MRLALVRLAPARHCIVWTRHHLTVDGWSLGIILDEVFALYKALQAGHDHGLLPASAFRAYADWEKARDGNHARSHWQRSEEHTSELQSLMRISYAVFCLKKKNNEIHKKSKHTTQTQH